MTADKKNPHFAGVSLIGRLSLDDSEMVSDWSLILDTLMPTLSEPIDRVEILEIFGYMRKRNVAALA